MEYNISYHQWLGNVEEEPLYGMRLKEFIFLKGYDAIPSGTVMCYDIEGTKSGGAIIFQTLGLMHLHKLKDLTLVGYEPGSLILPSDMKIVPTFRFRNCRMPTKTEFFAYSKMRTV